MKIVVIGNYGATNLGDELILLGVLREVFFSFQDASISVMSALPEITEKLVKNYFPEKDIVAIPRIPFGFHSFAYSLQRGDFRLHRSIFQKADLVLFGGGGLFADDESRLAVPLWYVQASKALHFRKSVKSRGISVGPLHYRLSGYLIKRLFSRAGTLDVRDTMSKNEIQSLLPNVDVSVKPDPVFSLTEEFLGFHDVFSSTKPDKPYICLSLRDFHSFTENMYKIFAQVLDGIVEDLGLDIVFIPFQTFPKSDTDILNKIIVHMRKRDHILYPEFSEKDIVKNLKLACFFIKNAKFLIGMRLHSNFLSAILGTPFLPVIYSQKTDAFLKDHIPELIDFTVRLSAGTSQEVAKKAFFKIKSFFHSLEKFKNLQKKMTEKLYNELRMDFSQSKSYLKQS